MTAEGNGPQPDRGLPGHEVRHAGDEGKRWRLDHQYGQRRGDRWGPNDDAYNASKAGVRLLTKTVALDAATHRWGIRVNAVFPGVIDTGILTPDELKQFDGITPLGRVGKPEDIAPICVYLDRTNPRLPRVPTLLSMAAIPLSSFHPE